MAQQTPRAGFDPQVASRARGTNRIAALGVATIGLLLCACGGGGSGTGVNSTPAPPPAPPPPPPPLPPPTVDLLAGKKTPLPPVLAADGGPTLESGATFDLPLTITAVSANFSGDAVTINQGASLQVSGHDNGALTIYNTAFGIDDDRSGATLADGRKLNLATNLDLDYTRYGDWWVSTETANSVAFEDNGTFIGGLETPVGNIPTVGTASYSGKVAGHYSDYYLCTCASFSSVIGNVSLSANFGNRTLSGMMTQMQVIPDFQVAGFMNDVSFSASFANAQNWFNGSTAVASMPNSPFALAANGSGSIVGAFYGPSAQEVGAVWTLSDGTRRVIGSFGAKSGN